jgi:hypothetical protein
MLSALSRVNLIRNRGFERTDHWQVSLASHLEPNTAEVSVQDNAEHYSGNYAAFGDTRTSPTWQEFNTGVNFNIYQEFVTPKVLADFDSISWSQCVDFKNGTFYRGECFMIALRYLEGPVGIDSGICYGFMKTTYTFLDGWVDVSQNFSAQDTAWRTYARSYAADFADSFQVSTHHFSQFVLTGYGWWLPSWYGQKVWFDDIRLMGWADYDAALTRITGELSNPSVMLWNNGRKDQDGIKVTVAISDSGSVVYVDTVVVVLDSDDSVEVAFKSWTPEPGAEYLITYSTGNFAGMDADECDEDDTLTKEYLAVYEGHTDIQPEIQMLSAVGPRIVCSFSQSAKSSQVSVFDASGRKVDELSVPQLDGVMQWGENRSPGVYFMKVEADGNRPHKVVLVK